ncbi:MAG TPA: SpoIIE family protein phosphatase [Candidatus Ozemobacteraceae bacterium]|nr:SpoIIE family protein phosphatase [Candidatus Ozemobacteraceae bacterium]
MTDKIGIAVCSHFFHELEAAIRLEGWNGVVPLLFPSFCGKPPLTREALKSLSAGQGKACSNIHILGGNCCKKLSVELPPDESFKIHVFNPCFAMFSGETQIFELCSEGAYLVTPGWLACWREKLRYDGFDQDSARQFYGESLKSIVLLETLLDPQSESQARDFGEYVNLPCRTRKVGLEYFRLLLRDIIGSQELFRVTRTSETSLKEARCRIAEYSMMSDVLARLARSHDETEAFASILELVQTLFAPRRVNHLKWTDGAPASEVTSFPSLHENERDAARTRLAGYSSEYGRTEDGEGFFLKFSHRGESLATIELQGIAFPNNIDRYINSCLSFVPAVGLALANIRAYTKLETQLTENRSLLATLQNDIEAAGTIQRELLPSPGERFPPLEVSWYFSPCSTVGGDLLNIIRLDRDHVAFYMFDVAGHGVHAALSAVSIHEMISSFLRQGSSEGIQAPESLRPKAVAEILHEQFMARKHGYFTLTYGVIALKTGIVKYVRAGHTPLLLKEAAGTLRILDAGNSPISMFPDAEFTEQELLLRPGDRLLLYSDGITEAMRFPSLELYGDERLHAMMYSTENLSVDACVSEIIRDLDSWLGETKPRDDISLLAIDMGSAQEPIRRRR